MQPIWRQLLYKKVLRQLWVSRRSFFEYRSNFAYYFFTLLIRWNERKKAGCIRGVSHHEMWWQWHYEAAQSLLTFDSRNDVSIPWRQNWSNSGSVFLQIWRTKFTLNFEIAQTVIMVLRTNLRFTAVKRQPSSLFFGTNSSNQIKSVQSSSDQLYA